MTRSTDALSFSEKLLAMAMVGSLAYINTSPGSFEAAGVQEKHIHTEEDLHVIHRAKLITSIVFSTCFESVSARLGLEKVRMLLPCVWFSSEPQM
jgi:hypothetical protein